MSASAWLLIAWILVGAAVLFAHAVLLAQVWLGARKVGWLPRMLALFVPVAAPIVAWIDGRRVAPIVWTVLVLTYIGLRLAE